MSQESNSVFNQGISPHSSSEKLDLAQLDDMMAIETFRSQLTIRNQYARNARLTTVFEQPYIIKEFFFEQRHKGEWQIEHEMIQWLGAAGIATPKSYGYLVNSDKAALYKEFVSGQLLTQFDADTIAKLAQMFVAIHHRRVITRDAHDGNVIKTDAGEMMFIDFGKAKIFKKRNLSFWLVLIREQFFIKTKLLKDDVAFSAFLDSYINQFNYGSSWLLKNAIRTGNLLLQWRDNLRTSRSYSNP